MRKKSFKLLSVILSIAILMTSLPLSVFAFRDTEDDIDTITSEKEIFELVNLRTATTKQFKLEDGTYYLAQYDTDVHYLDDEGAWQDINNTLAESGNEISTADARIKFAKKTNGSNELFTIHTENRKLSLALNGSNKKVKAQITNNSSVEDDIPELQKMTDLKNISASVRYEDVLDGTDIEYVIKGSNVKENIIVKEKAESYIYEFTLSLNNLVAVMDENGDIIISDSSSGDAVYIIPAAFMYDSAGVRSESVTMSLLPLGNGKYTLTITPSAEWMNADERVYPITIDPPLYNFTSSSVLDTKVSTAYPNNVYATNTTLNVGTSWRSYWKMTSLPTLPSSAYIIDAEMRLYSITSEYVSGYVGAYEVYSDWDSTLCWNDVINDLAPKGMYSTDGFSDYQHIVHSSNLPAETYYSFNITPSVKRWYDGENYGVMFGPIFDAPFNGTAEFRSNDYSVQTERPLLCITYKDMKGLEDYWSYSSQSAGFAGSSAVNNATGNLTVTIPTLTTTDALMPFTPTLVYNSALAGRDFNSANAQTGYTSTYMPKGFKLNIGETLIKKAYINENNATKYYFIWSDADGTEHYFMPTTTAGIYKDEDGMMLELQELATHATIKDGNNNTRRFEKVVTDSTAQGWYLSSIHDINGNMVIFDETARPETVKLCPSGGSSIIQLKIAYKDGCNVPYMVWNPNSGEAVIFRYSNTPTGSIGTSYGNYLRQVVRAHGSTIEYDWSNFYDTNSNSNYGSITVDAIASYTYDSNGYITNINNELSKYQISYLYRSGKVALVQESAYANGTVEEGQTITLTYGTSSTVVRTSGTDDIINTTDDLLTTYCFDKEGRTISCYTTDTSKTQIFGASSGEYEDEFENAKNNLKSSVQTRQQSSNYILNGGFDEIVSGSIPYWTTSGMVQNYTSVQHKGVGCLGLKLDYSEFVSSAEQYVYLDEGEYYLSMYIDTFNMKSAKVFLRAESTNSAHNVSIRVPTNEYQAAPSYVPTGMKITASPSVPGTKEEFKISIIVMGNTSTTEEVWVDSIMLSRTTGAAEYDMLELGHFEESNEGCLPKDVWGYTYGDGNIVTVDSENNAFGDVLKLDNSIGELPDSVSQTITLTTDDIKAQYDDGWPVLSAPRLFTLSGWGKGTSQTFSGDGQFELRAVLNYYNGTSTPVTETHYIKFDKSITDWQFASGVFKEDQSKGLLESITIEIYYINNAGIGYFDNISLIMDSELGGVYRYNQAGLLEYSQIGGERTWYHYNLAAGHIKPVRVISSQKTVTVYFYDTLGRVTSEVYKRYTGSYDSETGAINGTETPIGHIDYLYNVYGLVTAETQSDTLTDPDNMALSVAYTSYNLASGSHIFGTVASETDALGNVTKYFYDSNNGRLLAVIYPKGNGVAYTYDGMGNLTSVMPAKTSSSSSGGYEAQPFGTSVTYGYDSDTNRLDYIRTDSTRYSFTYDSFGNTSYIQAGHRTLARYEYNANNGKLSVLTYGNGKKVKYVYDVLDRISEIQYNTSGTYQTAYKYTYDTAGNLFSIEDIAEQENTVFKYDESGRLLSSYVYDVTTFRNLYGTYITYDDQDRVSYIKSSLDYSVGNSAYSEQTKYKYSYSEQTGNISSLSILGNGVTGVISPTYDGFGRTTAKTVSLETQIHGRFYNSITYDYHTGGAQNYESALVSNFVSNVGTSSSDQTETQNWRYVYDANGNITQINDSNGNIQYQYTYDELGQLIREDNRPRGFSYTYTYDNAGNILTKKRYYFATGTLGTANLTNSYSYDDVTWGDLLTEYHGDYIEYDEIGNPIKIGFYDDATDTWWYGTDLTWDGRELVSYRTFEYVNDTDISYGPTTTYTYNADGIRTSKTVNGAEHRYYLNGSQIIGETWTSNGIEYLLMYVYDETGSPLAIKYRTSEYASGAFDVFFLEKNLQGDIVAVYDESGFKLGEYVYDAWGNFTIISNSTDASLGDMILCNYNPFRYRGYYYDIGIGLYYLQSRYYNAQWGRFINPDRNEVITATPDQLTDKNLFAYCDNNPVMRGDADGEFWHIIAGAVVGVATQYVSDVVSSLVSGESFTESLKPTSSIVDYLAAGASGALAATGIGAVGSAIANAAIDGTAVIANSLINGEEVNTLELAVTVTVSAFTAGEGINGKNLRGVYKRSKNVISTTASARKRSMYRAKIKDVKSKVNKHVGSSLISGIKNGVSAGFEERWDINSFW